jgi:hypothetical protein
MTLRKQSYDHPNYTVVRHHFCDTADVASATAFARFRCRAKVVVTGVSVVVISAASAAKVVFTVQRAGSANTTFTIVSATSAGALTAAQVAVTLDSLQLINLVHSDTGDYQVCYEYQVLPEESLSARV